MEQVGKGKAGDTPIREAAPGAQAAPSVQAPPGEPAAPVRQGSGDAAPGSGRSGEGARSALEQLVEQQKKRDAQRLRDAHPPAAGPAS